MNFKTIADITKKLLDEYKTHSNRQTLLVDGFIIFTIATSLVQFLFMVLVGNFPFNSFLSGFLCHVGLFALAVSLRLQLSASTEFSGITSEKAFGDFMFGGIVLLFVVFSFLG